MFEPFSTLCLLFSSLSVWAKQKIALPKQGERGVAWTPFAEQAHKGTPPKVPGGMLQKAAGPPKQQQQGKQQAQPLAALANKAPSPTGTSAGTSGTSEGSISRIGSISGSVEGSSEQESKEGNFVVCLLPCVIACVFVTAVLAMAWSYACICVCVCVCQCVPACVRSNGYLLMRVHMWPWHSCWCKCIVAGDWCVS